MQWLLDGYNIIKNNHISGWLLLSQTEPRDTGLCDTELVI